MIIVIIVIIIVIIIQLKPFNSVAKAISTLNAWSLWFYSPCDSLPKRMEKQFGKSALCPSLQRKQFIQTRKYIKLTATFSSGRVEYRYSHPASQKFFILM